MFRSALQPTPTPVPGRVLIVDDEDRLRRLYARSLRRAGFDVVAERDAPGGLRRLREDRRIRLVLLDLNMPEMDGWAFRHEQRSDPTIRNVPTVIVTGAPISELVERELHAAEYLLKPVGPEQLVRLVSDYCEPIAW